METYDADKVVIEFELLEVVGVKRVDHFLKDVNEVASALSLGGLHEDGQHIFLACSPAACGRRVDTYHILRSPAMQCSL